MNRHVYCVDCIHFMENGEDPYCEFDDICEFSDFECSMNIKHRPMYIEWGKYKDINKKNDISNAIRRG